MRAFFLSQEARFFFRFGEASPPKTPVCGRPFPSEDASVRKTHVMFQGLSSVNQCWRVQGLISYAVSLQNTIVIIFNGV